MGEDADGGPTTLTCPECGRNVRMGLPSSARVEAVTATPDAGLDEAFAGGGGPRRKRRRNVCTVGHEFHVYFEF